MTTTLLLNSPGGYQYNEPHGQAFSYARSQAFKAAVKAGRHKGLKSRSMADKQKEWYAQFKAGKYVVPKGYLDEKGWGEGQSYSQFKESPKHKENAKKSGSRLKGAAEIYKKILSGKISTSGQKKGESLRKYSFRLLKEGKKPAEASAKKPGRPKKEKQGMLFDEADKGFFWGSEKSKKKYKKSEKIGDKITKIRTQINRADIPKYEKDKLRKVIKEAKNKGGSLKATFDEIGESFAKLGYTNLNPPFPFVPLKSWTGGVNVVLAIGSTHAPSNFDVKKTRKSDK